MNKVTLKADSKSTVTVSGTEVGSGHQWISINGLIPKNSGSTKSVVGASKLIEFEIKMTEQNSSVKTYIFQFKRNWEKTPVSTCEVTIVKK